MKKRFGKCLCLLLAAAMLLAPWGALQVSAVEVGDMPLQEVQKDADDQPESEIEGTETIDVPEEPDVPEEADDVPEELDVPEKNDIPEEEPVSEDVPQEEPEEDSGLEESFVNATHDMKVPLYRGEESVSKENASLPSYYSSVDNGMVTPVRNQGIYGTCWAHAWLAAAEARLMPGFNWDLSELQLAYVTYHEKSGTAIKGLEGDKVKAVGNNFLDIGGNNLLTTFISAAGKGAVSETDNPAVAYSKASPSYVLPDKYYCDSNRAIAENVYWLDMADPSTIKSCVQRHGAVATSMYYSSSYYQSSTYSYYDSVDTSTNHSVAIVGWNDNYSKNNFKKTPPGNGAWLVKNSYGTSFGKNGYFWVSYYDTSMKDSNAFVVWMTPSVSNHIYQYDGGVNPYSSTGMPYAANVFTSDSDYQVLSSVRFATRWSNVNCRIEIYRGVKDTPTSGVKMGEVKAYLDYAGYYNISLSGIGMDLALPKGEKVSVVVYLWSDGSSYYQPDILLDRSADYGWVVTTSSSKAGQSFVSNDGENWTDVGASGGANCRIKLTTQIFSKENWDKYVGEKPMESMSLEPDDLYLPVGTSKKLTVKYSPVNTTDSLNVTWKSSNTSVAVVDNAGKVTAKGNGTAVISCVGSRFTATCKVTTYQDNISSASVEEIPIQKYTGKAVTPKLNITYGTRGTLTEGVDYRLAFANNIQEGTARVTIYGIGRYTGSIVRTFRIVKQLYGDVPELSGWRYDAVKFVKNRGIMNGISGTNNFAPDEPITRAMFATIIYRMSGSPSSSYKTVFSDVPDGNYFSIPVVWANKAGIITGYGTSGRFGPHDNISRQDMAVIMYRYAGYRGLSQSGRTSLTRFPDQGEVSGYARNALEWAVGNGLINGRSNTGMLDPKGNATRVECAAIIMRFMNRYGL